VKAKAVFHVALYGCAMLGYFVHRHVTGGDPITPGIIIVICLGAPVVGLASWFRHEWVQKKVRELSSDVERDRETL
jgi:hypothetical protein